jgi:hypothetical protein
MIGFDAFLGQYPGSSKKRLVKHLYNPKPSQHLRPFQMKAKQSSSERALEDRPG